MTRESPVAQANIDLMHLAMGQISAQAGGLESIGRITTGQHNIITAALDSLGEAIGRVLHPNGEYYCTKCKRNHRMYFKLFDEHFEYAGEHL